MSEAAGASAADDANATSDHRIRPVLEPADAALVDAIGAPGDDLEAPFDLDALAAEVGTTRVLLEAVERAGLLLPHHVDDAGIPRFSPADAAAVRSGLALLDAGLPLSELLSIASLTDAAVRTVAEQAVEVFLRFVRDPVLGTTDGGTEAGRRLVTAYEQMLPATERLVAHHLRRRLVAAALARLADDAAASDRAG
jgi:DNA-binding transcriptional MerR regulator